ncbi:MAG: DUF3035 domain-containing protein [Pseudomonadota bacterium]
MVGGCRSTWRSFAVLGLVAAPLLTACGGGDTVQEALGFQQRGPDELAVIKRPPLIVPPDYNLRPPRSGSEDDGSNAASDAARKTLIGPSSSIDAAPSEARAILTGTNSENDVSDAASEGQNLLVSRSQRAERDLDKVVETRAENRVDRALLRRLLAWTPDSRTDASDDAESEDAVVVQLVSRSQTVIDAIPDQTSTE